MSKKNDTELKKASGFIGACALAGEAIGGSVGVAGFGSAFGLPLVLVGGAVGLAGYGAYKALDSCLSEDSENIQNHEEV